MPPLTMPIVVVVVAFLVVFVAAVVAVAVVAVVAVVVECWPRGRSQRQSEACAHCCCWLMLAALLAQPMRIHGDVMNHHYLQHVTSKMVELCSDKQGVIGCHNRLHNC